MTYLQTVDTTGTNLDAYAAFLLGAPSPLGLLGGVQSPVLELANDELIEILDLKLSEDDRSLADVFQGTARLQVRLAFLQCLDSDEPVSIRIVHPSHGQPQRLCLRLRRVLLEGRVFVGLAATNIDTAHSLSEIGEKGVLAEIGPLSRGLVYIHHLASDDLRYSDHPLALRLGLLGDQRDAPRLRARVHPDDADRLAKFKRLVAAASDEEVIKDTFRIQQPAGDCLWLNIRARAFARDARGKIQQVIGVATDVTELHLQAAARAAAASALASAELNERRRIGRELHDSTAQLLVVARLGLGALRRRHAETDRVEAALADIDHAVAQAQAEIRSFSYMLHPPALVEQGLLTTLRGYALGFARRTGLKARVRAPRQMPRLPFSIEVALFRVAQEALMNAFRHAQASAVTIRLSIDGGTVKLEVEDNGIGMSLDAKRIERAGVGISAMKARMAQLGGDLTLVQANPGLKVRAVVEIDEGPDQ